MLIGRFKIGRSMPKLAAAAQLRDAMRGVAGDREGLDHPVGDRVRRLRARGLVLVELGDALALLGEAEAA